MYYPEEIIEELRSRSDIVDVISSYVSLKRRGNRYFGLCPFHNEKTGSFSVSPSKQMYYCFGCGAGGNVISFIMEYESMSFPEALRFLAKRCGMALPEREYSEDEKRARSRREQLLEIHKAAATHYYQLLYSGEGSRARRYLVGRGLGEETIRRFGLGYSSGKPGELYRFLKDRGYGDDLLSESGLVTVEERGARDKFWNRVMFPILDVNSRVIGFGGRVMGDGEPKYLNSPETQLFNKSRNLYGLNYARSSREDYLLLCEGYMDVIALQQAGFTNAVASLGTALTEQHCALIKRYAKQVIITYDSDGAGVNAARRAIPLLTDAGLGVKVLSMKPCKDPDEFIKTLGKEAYRERIESAKNAFLWDIDRLSEEYAGDDPAEKTAFYRETARRLSGFAEALERNSYIQAVAREHMIPEQELRNLVNSVGASTKIRPLRENATFSSEQKKGARAEKSEEKDDAALLSQRLFLTLLSEDASLLKKTEKWISPEDFTDPFYRELAEKLFREIKEGRAGAGAVLNDYVEDEEKERRAAAIFHAAPGTEIAPEDRDKAAADCIRRMRMERLDQEARSAVDLASLQRILKEKGELKRQKFEIGG